VKTGNKSSGRATGNNFDPITTTPSGVVIWRDYDNPGRPVITHGDEIPQDVRARKEKEKKEERRGAKE
jgi:hypothetical protein